MDKILFYDGECGLCQRSIRLIANWDAKHSMKFAPLNGELYSRHFATKSDLESVVYWEDGRVFQRSEAALRAVASLGGSKKLFLLFLLIPRLIRDFFYLQISKRRKNFSCIYIGGDERFLR